MRLACAMLVLTFACSSAPTTGDAGSQDGGVTHECPPDIQGWPYDATHGCFLPATTLTGICLDKPPPPNAKGLEGVCAVDSSGELYVVVVSTDATLSGEGWSFGPRAFPSLVHDAAPLSAGAGAQCTAAEQLMTGGLQPPASAMCGTPDAGAD